MFKKMFLFARILIGIITLILLAWIFLNEIQTKRGNPDPIGLLLIAIGFITLSNGVSYLSEAFKKEKKALKLLTGILALAVFVITFFPQIEDVNQIIASTAFLGVVGSSILISWLSTLEWMQIKKKIKWTFPFLFALFSGIYGAFIPAYIFRGNNLEQGGYFYVICGGVLFTFCLITNYLVAFKLIKLYSE